MAKLSAQQERFCRNIAEGMSQTDAYINAGYTDSPAARVGASKLLTKANILNRVAELQEKAVEKTALTVSHFAERLERLAVAAEKTALTQDAEGAHALADRSAADVARQCTMDVAKLLGLIVDLSKAQTENVHFTVSDEPMTDEDWEAEYGEKDAMEAPARSASSLN